MNTATSAPPSSFFSTTTSSLSGHFMRETSKTRIWWERWFSFSITLSPSGSNVFLKCLILRTESGWHALLPLICDAYLISCSRVSTDVRMTMSPFGLQHCNLKLDIVHSCAYLAWVMVTWGCTGCGDLVKAAISWRCLICSLSSFLSSRRSLKSSRSSSCLRITPRWSSLLLVITRSLPQLFIGTVESIREAPLELAPPLFGHCPNSDYTPPPALKRALWGTFFPGRFEQICQITVLTVHKCTKHPGKP